MNAMGRAHANNEDPALERLYELTDRMRRRAAELRERELARARRPPRDPAQLPLRVAKLRSAQPPPPPRHWADGREDEQDDSSRH
jgi:hypothetical protein